MNSGVRGVALEINRAVCHLSLKNTKIKVFQKWLPSPFCFSEQILHTSLCVNSENFLVKY